MFPRLQLGLLCRNILKLEWKTSLLLRQMRRTPFVQPISELSRLSAMNPF